MEGHSTEFTFTDPVDAIHFAQRQERKAEAVYRKIAENVDDPGIRTLMLEIAEEEVGHWTRLQNLLDEHFHAEY